MCREHLKAKAELGLKDEVYLFLCGNLVDVVTTMNGRELLHFMRLRTCQRAQWEIRNLAEMMLGQLRKLHRVYLNILVRVVIFGVIVQKENFPVENKRR